MARTAPYVLVTSVLLLVALPSPAHAQDATIPIGKGIKPASISQPKTGKAHLGEEPTLTGPDQTFTESGKSGFLSAGAKDGKPNVAGSGYNHSLDSASLGLGRKMLAGSLQLNGTGVSAGDNTAGVSANAYGHGTLNGLKDSHIQPHGVKATADVAGESHTTNTAVNPDCVVGEGHCVAAGKK